MGTFTEIVEYGIANGWSIELIAILSLAFLWGSVTWVIFKFFTRKNADVIGTMLEISVNLDQQARTLQTTTDAMKNLNENIKMLMQVDERVTEGQAVLIYSGFIETLFTDFGRVYRMSKKWVKDRHIDVGEDNARSILWDKFEVGFTSSTRELDDRLRNFKFNDNYLSKYLNDGFRQEIQQIQHYLYKCIVEQKNDVDQYLTSKCDLFKADFNVYLRDGIRQ